MNIPASNHKSDALGTSHGHILNARPSRRGNPPAASRQAQPDQVDGSYTKDEEDKLSGIRNRKDALEPNNNGPTWIFPKSRGIGRPDWTTAREREIGRLVDDIIEQLDFPPK
ncbi:MAG: hypothetical protein U1E53_31000 [Dongiaceae bacterium]